MELGAHPSLHLNCLHQITYAKFNLKIHYPPPYEREIWHYQKANTDQIRKAIEQFSWDRSFKNLDVNEMVFLFNRTIKKIQTIFHMKLSSVMIEIHLELTIELRS